MHFSQHCRNFQNTGTLCVKKKNKQNRQKTGRDKKKQKNHFDCSHKFFYFEYRFFFFPFILNFFPTICQYFMFFSIVLSKGKHIAILRDVFSNGSFVFLWVKSIHYSKFASESDCYVLNKFEVFGILTKMKSGTWRFESSTLKTQTNASDQCVFVHKKYQLLITLFSKWHPTENFTKKINICRLLFNLLLWYHSHLFSNANTIHYNMCHCCVCFFALFWFVVGIANLWHMFFFCVYHFFCVCLLLCFSFQKPHTVWPKHAKSQDVIVCNYMKQKK